MARPGAISLAHNGILLLDEAPEFGTRALETLRQPLEDGYIVLARSGGTARFPARIQLVLAANPCPCASPAGDAACGCSAAVRRRYLGRLSGPLLDRVDIQVPLLPVTAAQLIEDTARAEPSTVVAARVANARRAAAQRWTEGGWSTNAQVPGAVLRRAPWRLPATATADLQRALDAGSISARGVDRVLRLAWTIADLDGSSRPERGDIREALTMRMGRIG
jgi:magnesium chelatase family protein